MRTLAWNYRGVGRAPTVKGLKELIHESNPKIVFQSETKSKSPRINKIKSRLNFANYYYVEPIGRAGGLALFWRLRVELEIVYFDKNMITAFVYSGPPNSPWLLFAIYRPCRRNKRTIFWEMLKNMVLSFSGPWIIIGDLNCIKRAAEKQGGCSIPKSSINCLGTSWQTLELLTLVLTGCLSLGQIGMKIWQILKNALINVSVMENGKFFFPRLVLSICLMQIQTTTPLCLTPI